MGAEFDPSVGLRACQHRCATVTLTALANTEKQRAAAYRRDLQRLIAISFSAGELSKYAERWRVFTDREGGSEGGARALVRALEGRGKLAALVESLRAHKPLVEWPEPPPQPTLLQEPVLQEPASSPETEDDEALEEEETNVDDEPGESPSSRGEPLLDPYLEDEEEQRATPPAGGAIRRWLPSVAMGLAGIAVGATAMYLLHPEAKRQASANPANIAELARAHLEDRVAAVAEACQVPADGETARDVLGAAFSECGVPEIPASRRRMKGDPVITPSPSPAPAPRRPQPTRRGRRDTKSPSGAACLDGCQEVYNSCARAKCGSEPRSAAENAAWSRCLQECQSRRGRCRQACR